MQKKNLKIYKLNDNNKLFCAVYARVKNKVLFFVFKQFLLEAFVDYVIAFFGIFLGNF